ncbi:MAG: hypothetical protein J5706_09180, partial [Elusimicrobiales bacterium]|nr:hypothetical protein [Elusimicrobiales bacterium]
QQISLRYKNDQNQKGGRMLKKLREKSQNAITKFLGRPALAHLTVRTTSDWQNNTDFLMENGLL